MALQALKNLKQLTTIYFTNLFMHAAFQLDFHKCHFQTLMLHKSFVIMIYFNIIAQIGVPVPKCQYMLSNLYIDTNGMLLCF